MTKESIMNNQENISAQSLKVLIIEDDEGLNRLITKNLEREGYKTTSAYNGKEGLNQIITQDSQILLTDYKLPDMNAKELIAKLSKKQIDIPFIVMTGHGDEKIAVEMMRMGASDYIIKQDEFIDLLRHRLNKVCAEIENERKLKKAHQELQQSEKRVRSKLEAILTPDGDIGELQLEDILDIPSLQSLMDDFNALTDIGIGVIDLNGKVLVQTGWQDICTDFHRQHPQTNKNCLESDTILSKGAEPGQFKAYKCKNNMWDIVTPIYIGEKHIGNIFLGQFLYKEEEPDYDTFRKMARKYGFDEKEYLAALDRVPRWDKEMVQQVMEFYAKLANLLAKQSFSNLKLARTLEDKKRTEEDLRQSKNQYQTLLENSLVGIGLIDQQGKIIDCNESTLDILGYSKNEIKKLEVEDLFQNRKTFEEMKRTIEREGMQLNFETVLKHKNGKSINILANTSEIELKGQKVYQTALLDITSRKKAINKLKKSEDKFRSLIENCPAAILLSDMDGTILDYNRDISFSGIPREELLGKKLNDLDIFDKIKPNNILQNIREGNVHPFELNINNKNNNNLILQVHPAIIGDTGNRKLLFMILNITKRKEAEKELRKHSTAVKQSPSIIAITDLEGDLEYVNPKFSEVTGYDAAEVLGKNPSILKSGNFSEETYQELWNTITAGKTWRGEFHNRKKNGKLYWEEAAISPITDENNNITNYLKVAEDITHRKKAEQEKERLQQQLLQSQKLESIGTLAGGVAHDFNNIMTVIIGLSQLVLSRTEKSDPNYQNLESILNSSKRAAELTKQLLLFSRKQDMDFEIINLNETIAGLRKMLDRLISEEIEVQNDLDYNLWQIKADKNQIEQVIINLAINARDAMPGGGKLTISTQNMVFNKKMADSIPEIQEGNYVRMDVADTGKGIEEEIRDKIFDPFFTTKGMAEGTGMGLSVVHGIVKKHKGIIKVASKTGEGTIFTVYFPAQKDKPSKNIENETRNFKDFKGGGEAILVVEDEQSFLDYLNTILKTYGYNIFSAHNSTEALEIFKAEKENINLVLSDVIMPEMNGLELADKLRESKNDLPIILSSGYSDQKVDPADIRANGYKFIPKPYGILKILKLIKLELEENK
jgi:PAS domain S-box-containing protein